MKVLPSIVCLCRESCLCIESCLCRERTGDERVKQERRKKGRRKRPRSCRSPASVTQRMSASVMPRSGWCCRRERHISRAKYAVLHTRNIQVRIRVASYFAHRPSPSPIHPCIHNWCTMGAQCVHYGCTMGAQCVHNGCIADCITTTEFSRWGERYSTDALLDLHI